MNKSLQIYWKDKSGTSHRFWIYPRGTKFNEPCPGIYIYARETSPHKWIPIYIGQTENVNVRLTNHEQQECVDQNGATHIHVSIITDEKSRFTIEKDLIEQWKPVCNTQFELIAEEVVEANPDIVVRDEKGEVYTRTLRGGQRDVAQRVPQRASQSAGARCDHCAAKEGLPSDHRTPAKAN